MPPRRDNTPNLEQLLATQNQLLQLLVQNQNNNNNNNNNNNPPPPPPDNLTRFLRLNPPVL